MVVRAKRESIKRSGRAKKTIPVARMILNDGSYSIGNSIAEQGVSALQYLKLFFKAIVNGREDYEFPGKALRRKEY